MKKELEGRPDYTARSVVIRPMEFIGIRLFAVLALILVSSSELVAQQIQVSWDKTTVLIFDSPVQSVDRGNRLLLSKADEGALNLLKLKAGSKELPPTNLHVLTQDGRIHAFDVVYAESPLETTLDLRKGVGSEAGNQEEQGKQVAIAPYDFTPADFAELSGYLLEGAVSSSKYIRKQRRYEVDFWLKAIYYRQGLLFFDLRAINHSRIPLDLMGPEARVLDVRSGKKSSKREVVLRPYLGLNQEDALVRTGETASLLMAFPVFTIAEGKKLVFQIREKQGDRELKISIKGNKLLDARDLPMFNHSNSKNYGSGEL